MASPSDARLPDPLRNIAGVLENISEGFFALDREWRFTYVNGHAARLLQKPVSSLEGQLILDVFPEALGSVFQQEYERAVREQKSVRFEAFYPPINSWLSISAHPSEEGLARFIHEWC